MCVGLLVAIRLDPWLRGWNVAARLWRRPRGQLRRVLSVGLPIGGTLVVEVGVFAGAALIIGLLGETELAAHWVVMQIAATAFMVPLGIGLAACTRVGAAWCAGDPERARRAAWIATGLAGCVMAVSATIQLLAPGLLIGLFAELDDPASAAVVEQARALLVVAAVFQIVNGLQVAQQNAVRGIGDVRWRFAISVAGYWGIGLGGHADRPFPRSLHSGELRVRRPAIGRPVPDPRSRALSLGSPRRRTAVCRPAPDGCIMPTYPRYCMSIFFAERPLLHDGRP